MTKSISKLNPTGQLLLYQTEDGLTKLEVKLVDETVWLTQLAMAELFQTTKQNISLHLKNIFEDEELTENRVVKNYLTPAIDGKNYQTKFYNLDAFLKFNEHDILTNAGKVSKAVADQLALDQYEIYHQNRLEKEAEKEVLEDDKILKAIETKISKKRKKR